MRTGACAVMLSRNPAASKTELIELAELGGTIYNVQCDSGDPSAFAEILGWAHEHLPAVATLAHAAGTLGYDSIANVPEDKFWEICNAKVGRLFNQLTDDKYTSVSFILLNQRFKFESYSK